jgi:hypothetical protein
VRVHLLRRHEKGALTRPLPEYRERSQRAQVIALPHAPSAAAMFRSPITPQYNARRTAPANAMKRLPPLFLAVWIGLTLAGCAAGGGSSKQGSKAPSGKSNAFAASSQWRSADPRVLQRDVMNFADRFAGNMADSYDQLAANSTTPEAKNAALERKIGNVSAAYINASAPNPTVGLIDMIVTVTLLRQASQEQWFIKLYGVTEAGNVAAVLEDQEADIWNVGSRYLTENQLVELRGAIDRWHRDHPEHRFVSTVRLADFPEAKSPPPPNAKGPTSIFSLLFLDPLANLDPAVREVVRTRESAERMFFYAQRTPKLLSWESESLTGRVLELPPVQQFVTSIARFGEFADSTRSLADTLKSLPQTIATERERAVESIAKNFATERDAALRETGKLLATERDAAIKQLSQAVAVERVEILRATTQAIASEREAVVGAWNQSLQSQRQALVTDVDTLSSRAAIRITVLAGVVVALTILLSVLAVLIVRRAAPGAAKDSARKPLREYVVETGPTENDIRVTRSG